MSLEVFEKLEAKVQQAIDTITLLQMEIEEKRPLAVPFLSFNIQRIF